MKKLITLSFVFLCFFNLYGLEISLDTYAFKNENSHYIETYLRVLGNTIAYKDSPDGTISAKLEFTLIISQNEKIVAHQRFILNSPQLKKPGDFFDVKRFALPPGEYLIKVEVTDINKKGDNLQLEQFITIPTFAADIAIGSIQLLANVESTTKENTHGKNGLTLEPLAFGYATEDIKTLNIYTEVYQKTSDIHYVKYAIIEQNDINNQIITLKKYKKLEGKKSEPLLLQLPIDKLKSGNYTVVIEIIDRLKSVVGLRKVNFTRSNPNYDKYYWANYDKLDNNLFVSSLEKDQLNYDLKAISAILIGPKKNLLNYIIKEASINAKRKFLYDFWTEKAPHSPEKEYIQYMKVVGYADIQFNNNVGHGFETDRGYIFLKYGKPSNAISIDTEPDAPPYEIWQYSYIEETHQSNVRFIFYNPSLVHNDFQLLHSTCYRELQNPAWEVELYRDDPKSQIGATIDATQVTSGWNRKAKAHFNDF
ncbi:MAG: GWxTD domain-containing protein [Saprospiraceae bacterium]